jgi:hypothetical protein
MSLMQAALFLNRDRNRQTVGDETECIRLRPHKADERKRFGRLGCRSHIVLSQVPSGAYSVGIGRSPSSPSSYKSYDEAKTKYRQSTARAEKGWKISSRDMRTRATRSRLYVFAGGYPHRRLWPNEDAVVIYWKGNNLTLCPSRPQ